MRTIYFCWIVAALILTTGALQAGDAETAGDPADTPLSARAARADIALARASLEHLHAGYDRYSSRSALTDSWRRLDRVARNGIGRGELYLELSQILAQLRCDHTKAELPKDMRAHRNAQPLYLPFRFVLFDGRMYVDLAREDTSLRRGDEIVTIDGRTVAWWLQRIEPLVPVDGYANHVKSLVIAFSTEFMGPALDHFAPFIAPLENTVTLGVRDRADGVRHVVLPRQTYAGYQDMVGEKPYSSNFVDSVRFERIEDDAAYLAVDSFINYRTPIDPIAHLAPFFQILKREGRDKLILDLRRNGGGSDDAQIALFRHLIDRPVAQIDERLSRYNSISDEQRRYIDTWDKRALDPQPEWFATTDNGYYRIVEGELLEGTGPMAPAPNAFEGSIVMLTGPGNSSGSTHLIAALSAAGRITRVGERTGGSPTGATAGTLFFLTLPNSGIRIRIPAIRTVIHGGNLPQDNGLEPDIYAPMTRDAYFAGHDPALDAAKRFIR